MLQRCPAVAGTGATHCSEMQAVPGGPPGDPPEGDWRRGPAWQQMSALLTLLDNHVLERKLRLCQAALEAGPAAQQPGGEQVKLDLRLFEQAAGTVTFNLSGRSEPLVLDLKPYQPELDEAQLVARYLLMVVDGGDLDAGAAALPEPAEPADIEQLHAYIEDLEQLEQAQLQLGEVVELQPYGEQLEQWELQQLHDVFGEGGEADQDRREALPPALEQLQVREDEQVVCEGEEELDRLRARYEQQEAELVRREEEELAWRRARGRHREDDDDEAPCEFDAPPVLTLDVQALSRYGPGQQTRARNALLAPELLRPVRKLTKLHCEFDPDWALQLLSDVSPRLEELQLRAPAARHLQVVERMRRLTRLDVDFYTEEKSRRPPTTGPGPGALDLRLDEYVFRRPAEGSGHRGLRWLRVGHLPKLTAFSLLRAHRHTLEEVWLMVGSSLSAHSWPDRCPDLHLQLTRGGATWPRLRALVLYRWLHEHDRRACLLQVIAVQNALAGVKVRCHECGREPYTDF